MFSTRHMDNDPFIQDYLTTPEPDEFNAWLAMEPEVTTVSDKSANIWWGGESTSNRSYSNSRKVEDFKNIWNIAVDSEQLVFCSNDKWGNKLVRFWLTRDRNVTARIRYVKNDPHFLIEIFYNERNQFGRWIGTLVFTNKVHRTVTDEAELTVAKWVALEFAKAQASS